MKEKEKMTVKEILDAIKKDRKDFSNIICKEADFSGQNLSECNFSNSDLSYSSFDYSNLTDSNFSECNLEWTGFRFAKLTRAKFFKAKITYSVLNNAILDKTDMRNADLSWSLLFNCNTGGADLKGANTITWATDPSQVTEEGLKHVEKIFGKLGLSLPTSLAIRFSIDQTKGVPLQITEHTPENMLKYARLLQNLGVTYGSGVKTSYSGQSSGTSYSFESDYQKQTITETSFGEQKERKKRTYV